MDRWYYLDTNHLSSLVRRLGDPAVAQARSLLEQGSARLALSLVNVIELSAPEFVSSEEVGAFLDGLEVLWLLSPDDVFEAELHVAISKLLGYDTRPTLVGSDPSVMLGSTGRIPASPSLVLKAFREDSAIRAEVRQVGLAGVVFDTLKQDATLIQDPLELLRRMIARRQPRETPLGLQLPGPIDPTEVLKAVGGLRGFPAYHVVHRLLSVRLRDRTFRAKPNDVFDQLHASYSPYAAAIALDTGTAARVREMREPFVSNVVNSLGEWCQLVLLRKAG